MERIASLLWDVTISCTQTRQCLPRLTCAVFAKETELHASDVTEFRSERNTTNAEFAEETEQHATTVVHLTPVLRVLQVRGVLGAPIRIAVTRNLQKQSAVLGQSLANPIQFWT